MQETEAFISFEKNTKIMDIMFKVIAVVMVVVAIAASVIMVLSLNSGESLFGIYFYIAAAAVAIYVFVALPLGLVTLGRKSLIALYKAYSKVLGHRPRNAVDEIWEGRGTPKEEIVNNFERLNSLGFFENIFIDKEQLIVNIPEQEGHEFICPVCGGQTIIQDGDSVCDFCGAIKEEENNNENI